MDGQFDEHKTQEKSLEIIKLNISLKKAEILANLNNIIRPKPLIRINVKALQDKPSKIPPKQIKTVIKTFILIKTAYQFRILNLTLIYSRPNHPIQV